LPYAEFDAFTDFSPETGLGNRQGVNAQGELRECVQAGAVGMSFAGQAGQRLPDSDVGAGQNGAGGIGHSPGKFCSVLLRLHGAAKQNQAGYGECLFNLCHCFSLL
jgi:hypothetical protein